MKKNSFKGLNIDCIQYSNIRITYYSYSYSGTILNPNIIRIRPNIFARILFVFVFADSEKTNIIRICIRSKFWFRILFVFVFGPKNRIRSPLVKIYMMVVVQNQFYHSMTIMKFGGFWSGTGSISWNLVIWGFGDMLNCFIGVGKAEVFGKRTSSKFTISSLAAIRD